MSNEPTFEAETQPLRCLGHILNLGSKHAAKSSPDLMTSLAKLTHLNKHARKTGEFCQFFSLLYWIHIKKLEPANMKEWRLRPKLAAETRFNSTFIFVKEALERKIVYEKYAAAYALVLPDWKILAEVMRFGNLAIECTKFIEKDTTNASHSLPILRYLKKSLADIDEKLLPNFSKKATSTYEKYEKILKNKKSLVDSMILHNSYPADAYYRVVLD